MKRAILAILLGLGAFSAYSAARGSGSFTAGLIQLYKVAAREDPGWLTDSISSINNNFDIIASSMTGILNGTLGVGSTTFIDNQGTLQAGASFYVHLGSATSMSTNRLTGATGAIQFSMLQGGNTSYIQNRDTMQSGTTSYPEFTQTRNLIVFGTPNLAPGATNYIANQGTLQAGASFYVFLSSAATMSWGHAVTTGTLSVGDAASVSGTLTAMAAFIVNGNVTLGDTATDLITVNAGTSTYAATHVFNLATRAYFDILGDAFRIRLGTNIGRISIQDGDGTQGISITAGGGASIGWTIQAAANQACNTTCTHLCVMGTDAVTGGFLACTDTAADSCLCAGSN